MYSDLFSRVYDAFGWNYYPEEFAVLLQRWMEKNQIRVQSMLDIGCGTGVPPQQDACVWDGCTGNGSLRGNDRDGEGEVSGAGI